MPGITKLSYMSRLIKVFCLDPTVVYLVLGVSYFSVSLHINEMVVLDNVCILIFIKEVHVGDTNVTPSIQQRCNSEDIVH
jgi:hypothetical protein